MKIPRRNLLQRGLGLTVAAVFPSLWTRAAGATHSGSEIDERMADGRGLAGLTKHDLPTPTLVLDLDIFEANLARMSQHAKAAAINLRPHAKTHKCVEVARRQIKAGALGVCVATIREAEAMAAGGIKGLLITSELVGPSKISRLVRLAKTHPDTMAVVDHPRHADQLSEAAGAAKIRLNVFIDIDPGSRRTGVAAGAPALELAQYAAKRPHLNLRGIHCYSGASAHVLGFEARRAHSQKAMTPAIETFHQLKQAGLPIEILSGGSTGTYNIDPEFKGMTELQVGSYVFMDVDYRVIGGRTGPVYSDFGASLMVIATVISQNQKNRATVDAGFKAFATDRKFGPDVHGIPGVKYQFAGDEHGILDLQEASREVKLGDRIEFIVPHCDPNVNLYDRIYCLRGEKVEAVWPVARGYL
ncbi:MAG: DSD1 family PLP-dependent enzyme [Verrucomicrobia bacterium]|nr:DSD1 family PLP-dependent enzyme [Verrucomicrobiota bacterium]